MRNMSLMARRYVDMLKWIDFCSGSSVSYRIFLENRSIIYQKLHDWKIDIHTWNHRFVRVWRRFSCFLSIKWWINALMTIKSPDWCPVPPTPPRLTTRGRPRAAPPRPGLLCVLRAPCVKTHTQGRLSCVCFQESRTSVCPLHPSAASQVRKTPK